MKNLSICASTWYLRWKSPYPLSYPLLMVFYGIKWKINPKFVKIDLNEWNLVIFEWNLNGIYEIRDIAVVWSLDLQFEWNVCWFSGDRSKYCWWKMWGFWIWNESILALPASPLLCLSSPLAKESEDSCWWNFWINV